MIPEKKRFFLSNTRCLVVSSPSFASESLVLFLFWANWSLLGDDPRTAKEPATMQIMSELRKNVVNLGKPILGKELMSQQIDTRYIRIVEILKACALSRMSSLPHPSAPFWVFRRFFWSFGTFGAQHLFRLFGFFW